MTTLEGMPLAEHEWSLARTKALRARCNSRSPRRSSIADLAMDEVAHRRDGLSPGRQTGVRGLVECQSRVAAAREDGVAADAARNFFLLVTRLLRAGLNSSRRVAAGRLENALAGSLTRAVLPEALSTCRRLKPAREFIMAS
jgi:hypothetical protein